MSRTVFLKANPESRRGFAFQVRDESKITDDTPLKTMNELIDRAARTDRAAVRRSVLGSWYTCDKCGRRVVSAYEQPYSNGGVVIPLVGREATETVIKQFCHKCADEIRTEFHKRRAVAVEHERIARAIQRR